MYKFCPAFSGIALRNELDNEGRKLLSRLRCKAWDCPYCAIGNRARWRAFLFDVLPAISEVWSFHTITCPAWIHNNREFSPEDKTLASLSLIRANWDKLMKRIKRQVGSVEYFRVFEKHESGVLHVHFLLSHWIPDLDLYGSETELRFVDREDKSYIYWPYLKDNAAQCGFGYVCSSENLYVPTKAVLYTTKYMTKEDSYLGDMFGKYRMRRFQSSQGIGSQEKWGKSEDFWEIRSFVDASTGKVRDLNLGVDFELETGELYPSIEEYNKSDEIRKLRKIDK